MELNSHRAKKKPLNIGDAHLLKLSLILLYERLQRFMILTQQGKGRQNLSDVIQFLLRTAKIESHKVLGRSI